MKASPALSITALLWLAVVIGLMARLLNYSNAPGSGGDSPAHWPGSPEVPLDAQRPTLVMFAHPGCPCTRASLGELELLLARCQGRLSVHLLFFKPLDAPEEWAKTEVWRRACSIPEVTVHSDNAGLEARRFHAETSGQTLLYGADGRLLFHGGITIARGHPGDNPGRNAIVSLLDDHPSNPSQTPVFGCQLFETEAQTEGIACKK